MIISNNDCASITFQKWSHFPYLARNETKQIFISFVSPLSAIPLKPMLKVLQPYLQTDRGAICFGLMVDKNCSFDTIPFTLRKPDLRTSTKILSNCYVYFFTTASQAKTMHLIYKAFLFAYLTFDPEINFLKFVFFYNFNWHAILLVVIIRFHLQRRQLHCKTYKSPISIHLTNE